MADLHCTHENDLDESVVDDIDWARVDEEFGETAYCLACPCGSWVVESADGTVLARSDDGGTARTLRLPRAA